MGVFSAGEVMGFTALAAVIVVAGAVYVIRERARTDESRMPLSRATCETSESAAATDEASSTRRSGGINGIRCLRFPHGAESVVST